MTDLIQLTDLAESINREHAAVEQALTSAVEHAIKAGELLLQAKKRVAHGQWLPWLKAHCSVSERTAQAYMRLAREFPKLEPTKAQRVADLPLREALQALAAPVQEEPQPWFKAEQAEIDRIHEELKAELRTLKLAMKGAETFDDWLAVTDMAQATQNKAAENKLRLERLIGKLLNLYDAMQAKQADIDHASWQIGELASLAWEFCKDPGRAAAEGYASANADRRFEKWISTNFGDAYQCLFYKSRDLWQSFGHRRGEVAHIPLVGLYLLCDPSLGEDRREAILRQFAGRHVRVDEVLKAVEDYP